MKAVLRRLRDSAAMRSSAPVYRFVRRLPVKLPHFVYQHFPYHGEFDVEAAYGANGVFALLLGARGALVHAFEPVARIANRLRANVQLNTHEVAALTGAEQSIRAFRASIILELPDPTRDVGLAGLSDVGSTDVHESPRTSVLPTCMSHLVWSWVQTTRNSGSGRNILAIDRERLLPL